MGVSDAPQWLLPAFVRSAKAAGATAPTEQIEAAGTALIEMWSSQDRRFHNLRHVTDMLARLDEIAEETHSPAIMRLAVWYHGCVFSIESEQTYRANGGEDELASAAFAADSLHSLGIPEEIVDRICLLILNLKRHNAAKNDVDAMALSDADLGVLAIEPQAYKRYRALVREEYEHIPDLDYLLARKAIVSKLLSRERLFSSPMGQHWEGAARQNLNAELQVLCTKLAELDATPVSAPPAVETVTAPSDAVSPAVAPTPALAAGEASPASAVSASTGQLPAVSESPEPAREAHHGNSMESCADDIDRMLSMPRAMPEPADETPVVTESKPAEMTRQEKIEAERLRMQECLRRKTAEAKELREARTGEFTAIREEIVSDNPEEN